MNKDHKFIGLDIGNRSISVSYWQESAVGGEYIRSESIALKNNTLTSTSNNDSYSLFRIPDLKSYLGSSQLLPDIARAIVSSSYPHSEAKCIVGVSPNLWYSDDKGYVNNIKRLEHFESDEEIRIEHIEFRPIPLAEMVDESISGQGQSDVLRHLNISQTAIINIGETTTTVTVLRDCGSITTPIVIQGGMRELLVEISSNVETLHNIQLYDWCATEEAATKGIVFSEGNSIDISDIVEIATKRSILKIFENIPEMCYVSSDLTLLSGCGACFHFKKLQPLVWNLELARYSEFSASRGLLKLGN